MRGPQDLGGLPAGPIAPDGHVPTHWEKRIDAMMMLLFDPKRRLARVDESRRMQEALGEDYLKYGYYERWLQAITWLMMEKGVFSQEELDSRKAALRPQLEADRA
jgi:nitrile hydratase